MKIPVKWYSTASDTRLLQVYVRVGAGREEKARYIHLYIPFCVSQARRLLVFKNLEITPKGPKWCGWFFLIKEHAKSPFPPKAQSIQSYPTHLFIHSFWKLHVALYPYRSIYGDYAEYRAEQKQKKKDQGFKASDDELDESWRPKKCRHGRNDEAGPWLSSCCVQTQEKIPLDLCRRQQALEERKWRQWWAFQPSMSSSGWSKRKFAASSSFLSHAK